MALGAAATELGAVATLLSNPLWDVCHLHRGALFGAITTETGASTTFTGIGRHKSWSNRDRILPVTGRVCL
jgi:hypothetical protein